MNIRERTQAKEIRLSALYIITKTQVIEQGKTYLGTLGQAAQQGYYTISACQNMGLPVTNEELEDMEYYAMFSTCYQHYCIASNGKYVRPCLPVFNRRPYKGA